MNPFKIFAISLLAIFASGAVCAQTTWVNHGFNYSKSNSYNWGKGQFVVTNVIPYSQFAKAGGKIFDVITEVNGVKVENLADDKIPFTTAPMTFTIRRSGQREPLHITFTPAIIPPNSFDEWTGLHKSFNQFEKFHQRADHGKNIFREHNIQSYRDMEVDLLRYGTFDFEYVSKDEPLIEKEIAMLVQSRLEKMGLRRDRENPDMLVMLDFYKNKDEKYIPPQQEISTRYGTVYNVWTERRETRQYIESSTVGGYTDTKFWYTLKIVFMDAALARKEGSSPAFWQAEGKIYYTSDVALTLYARDAVPLLLKQFYNNKGISFQSDFVKSSDISSTNAAFKGTDFYYPMGVLFYDNKKEYSKVAYVYPGSPADKAGIQAGDELQRWLFSSGKRDVENGYYPGGIFKSVKTSYENDNPFYSYLFFQNFRDGAPAEVTLNFKLKRGNKTLTLPVTIPKVMMGVN